MPDPIKALAPKMPTPYLCAFFAEKDIPKTTFEVEGESGTNHIPNVVVVEHIALCSVEEASKIGEQLRKIDFYDGSINHFLKHLAQAIAK